MSQPYVGEIRMFGGNFPPAGWMFCDGQLLPISENDTLFNLIGTTYGGDGLSTFALPNLQSRIPIHQGTLAGNTYIIGETGGTEDVALSAQHIPNHTHPLLGSTANGSQASPKNNVLASSTGTQPYAGFPVDTDMAPTSISPAGGSQPHSNMQPYLCVSFIISLFGIYPSQT